MKHNYCQLLGEKNLQLTYTGINQAKHPEKALSAPLIRK